MHTMLVAARTAAPAASAGCPDPMSIPHAAVGGRSATATMTPTRVADAPVVNATTPAAPDARARMMSPVSTAVLLVISSVSGSGAARSPKRSATMSAVPSPRRLERIAERMSLVSPSVVPNARAVFGPRSGAMTIAPMMISGESLISPTHATMVARMTMMMNTWVTFAESLMSSSSSSRETRPKRVFQPECSVSDSFSGLGSSSGSGSGG